MFLAWLKGKWRWVLGAFAGLSAIVLVALAGRRATGGEIRAAVARRKLQDAVNDWKAKEMAAVKLKGESIKLAEDYMAVELETAAAKEKAGALSISDRDAELKRRGLLKD